MDDYGVDLLEEALGSSATPPKPVSGSPFAKKDVPSLARYIKSDACRQIYLMIGAGVSTSAGIPDFRSPETGLYANLARLKLPYPEAVFDIQFFRKNPNPFYTLAKELYPGKFRPTLTHSFIKLLSDKGLLGLCLTQNIDTLERLAGIPADKIVEAHGSFATQRCIVCKRPFDDAEMKKVVEEDRIPRCEICKGLVKPDIVFFGESLPPKFFNTLGKLTDADLLIVMGTSLTVQPFASLISMVTKQCPRVLINLDRVGGIGSGRNDLVFLGKCDDIIRDLARALGWEDELEKEWTETAKTVDIETPQGPTEKKADEDKAKLEQELEKITDRVGNALSLTEKDEAGIEQTEVRSGTGSGTSKDVEARRESIPELPKIPQTGGEEGRQDPEQSKQVANV